MLLTWNHVCSHNYNITNLVTTIRTWRPTFSHKVADIMTAFKLLTCSHPVMSGWHRNFLVKVEVTSHWPQPSGTYSLSFLFVSLIIHSHWPQPSDYRSSVKDYENRWGYEPKALKSGIAVTDAFYKQGPFSFFFPISFTVTLQRLTVILSYQSPCKGVR